MSRIIKTIAEARRISAGTPIKNSDGMVIGMDNEGQYCMALVPTWKDWGSKLMDGTELQEGKHYKITIEIEEYEGKGWEK